MARYGSATVTDFPVDEMDLQGIGRGPFGKLSTIPHLRTCFLLQPFKPGRTTRPVNQQMLGTRPLSADAEILVGFDFTDES